MHLTTVIDQRPQRQGGALLACCDQATVTVIECVGLERQEFADQLPVAVIDIGHTAIEPIGQRHALPVDELTADK